MHARCMSMAYLWLDSALKSQPSEPNVALCDSWMKTIMWVISSRIHPYTAHHDRSAPHRAGSFNLPERPAATGTLFCSVRTTVLSALFCLAATLTDPESSLLWGGGRRPWHLRFWAVWRLHVTTSHDCLSASQSTEAFAGPERKREGHGNVRGCRERGHEVGVQKQVHLALVLRMKFSRHGNGFRVWTALKFVVLLAANLRVL